jgi:hypothetical protein
MADSSQYGNSEATRRRLAAAMMQEGMQTSPIRSPWQGVARIVQAMMGGYNMHTLDKEAKERETKEEADWTSLPGLDGAPSEAAGWQTSVAPTDGPKENIGSPAPTSRFTPEEGAEIKALMVNPATRKVGLELYMEKLKPKAPEYDFKTVKGSLVRADKRTGKAESVFTAPDPAGGGDISDEALITFLGGAPTPAPAAASPASPPPTAAPAPSQAAPVPQVQPPGMMKLGGPVDGPVEGEINPDTEEPYTAAEIDEITAGGNDGTSRPVQVAQAGGLDAQTKALYLQMLKSPDPQVRALGRSQVLNAMKVMSDPLKAARINSLNATAAVNAAKAPKSPEQAGAQFTGALEQLQRFPEEFGTQAFERGIGPWLATSADEGTNAGIPGAVLNFLPQQFARGMAEVNTALTGGAKPTEVRDRLETAALNLAAVMKPFVRKPGEGAWSDKDQANLEKQVGFLSRSRDIAEYNRRLQDIQTNVSKIFQVPVKAPQDQPRSPNAPMRAEDEQTWFERMRGDPQELQGLAERAVESPAVASLLQRFEMAGPAKSENEQRARDALLAAIRAKEGAR